MIGSEAAKDEARRGGEDETKQKLEATMEREREKRGDEQGWEVKYDEDLFERGRESSYYKHREK